MVQSHTWLANPCSAAAVNGCEDDDNEITVVALGTV